MSLPKIPDKLPPLEESLSAILTSIAMAEAALSHVLTAESQKIEYVIECAKTNGCNCASMKDILAVNNSVTQMIKVITELQLILKEKLDIATKYLPCLPHPPHPPHPPCPPRPPYPPQPCEAGISTFDTETRYTWCRGKTLFMVIGQKCNRNVKLVRRDGQSLIILPHEKEVEIRFELDAVNNGTSPAIVDIEFLNNNKIVKVDTISSRTGGYNVKMTHEICYQTPGHNIESAIAFRLSSLNGLSDVNAKVSVKVKK